VTQLGALIADGFYTERTSRAGDQRDRILNVTNDAWVVLWKEVPESIAVKVEPWLCQMEKQGEERSEMIGDILEALAALYFTSREYLHLQALVSAVAKLMWPSPEASFSAAVAWRPGSYKGGSPGWCAKAGKTIEIYSIRIHFFDSHSLSKSPMSNCPCKAFSDRIIVIFVYFCWFLWQFELKPHSSKSLNTIPSRPNFVY
jgi:hypothetical protein